MFIPQLLPKQPTGLIRAVIFVGLYLILYRRLHNARHPIRYGTAQVDGLMTPSLITGLIGCAPLFAISVMQRIVLILCRIIFLPVPFVVIHTILSPWYRQAPRPNMPRNALHMACSHLLVSWLRCGSRHRLLAWWLSLRRRLAQVLQQRQQYCRRVELSDS